MYYVQRCFEMVRLRESDYHFVRDWIVWFLTSTSFFVFWAICVGWFISETNPNDWGEAWMATKAIIVMFTAPFSGLFSAIRNYKF